LKLLQNIYTEFRRLRWTQVPRDARDVDLCWVVHENGESRGIVHESALPDSGEEELMRVTEVFRRKMGSRAKDI
jgi:hypothetical protein